MLTPFTSLPSTPLPSTPTLHTPPSTPLPPHPPFTPLPSTPTLHIPPLHTHPSHPSPPHPSHLSTPHPPFTSLHSTPTSITTQNCVLLFKELPLYLWVPESCDLQMVRHWLVNEPLTSFENRLARVILSGLNWGTKSEVRGVIQYVLWCYIVVGLDTTGVMWCDAVLCCVMHLCGMLPPLIQDGSSELVLPWSMHRSVALALVEAHACHLPSHPGGRDYTPIPTGLGKVPVAWGCLSTRSPQL